MVMAAVSLVITIWLVPVWIGEFLQALTQYKDYAGSTGAESLWGKGPVSTGMSAFFALLGILLSIASYRARRGELHFFVYSYVLVLQCLIFPQHLPVTVIGMPVFIFAVRRAIATLNERRWSLFCVLSLFLISAVYTLYRYWFGIIAEAGLTDRVTGVFLRIRDLLPNTNLYTPILLLLILGMIMSVEKLWERSRPLNFGKLAFIHK
jgi:hypothetical protein